MLIVRKIVTERKKERKIVTERKEEELRKKERRKGCQSFLITNLHT